MNKSKLESSNTEINETIESFLSQLSDLDASKLSDLELQELQSIMADFKSDINALSNIEELADKFKQSLENRIVVSFQHDVKQSAENSKTMQNEMDKLNNSNKVGINYDKLQRD